MHWKRAVWLVKHNLSTKLLSLHLAFFVYQHLVDKLFLDSMNPTVHDSKQQTSLPSFPQVGKSPRESYEEWNDALIIMAGSYTRSNPEFGLLGAVLSPPVYLIAAPLHAPWVPLVHPGNAIPAGAQDRADHALRLKSYENQQEDLRDLKGAMVFSQGQDILRQMRLPVVGMATRTVQWICNFLFDNFGSLSPAEFDAIKDMLQLPFQPESTTLLEHIGIHLSVHEKAVTNNAAFSEDFKVAQLLKSVIPSNRYHDALKAWGRAHPTIPQQTFANLATALRTEEDTNLQMHTVGRMGYGSAAAIVAPSAPIMLPNASPTTAEFIAQIVAATIAAQATQTNRSSTDRVRAVDNAGQSPRVLLYCFTHGMCSHTSEDCIKPSANHNRRATARNTMGGAEPKRQARNNRRF